MTQAASTTNETQGTEAPMARCWICGRPADSGEHKAKKSDLRAVQRHVSQARPLILNDANSKNRKVSGLNADPLKWPKSLCQDCNTTLTQPYDRAWEAVSAALGGWTPPLRPGSVVRANRIFPMDTARSMLAVHLYFVKAFGCLVVEAAKQGKATNINVPGLATAIKNGRAYSDIYLGFGIPKRIVEGPIVSGDDLHTIAENDGSLIGAWWHYNVNGICVRIVYVPSRPQAVLLAKKEGLWHPRDGGHRFVVRDWTDEAQSE